MGRHRLRLVAGVVLLSGFVLSGLLLRGQAMQTTKPAGASAALFAEIDRLLRLGPLTPASVGDATGMRLSAVPGESSEYFQVYAGKGAAARPFASAELRVPTAAAAKSAGELLVLTLSPGQKIGLSEVSARYGKPGGLDVPQPDAPADEPVYHAYRLGKVKVSFGFTRSDPAVVVAVVIDRSAE